MGDIGHPSDIKAEPVEIASSESLSGAVDLRGRVLTDILMPAAWDAATLTFQYATALDGTFVDMYDDANVEYEVGADAGIGVTVNPAAFRGKAFLRVRSGTSGTPVAQAAARVLTLLTAEASSVG